MKDAKMDIEGWRTVQLFIDDNGVAEVEVNPVAKNSVRCNCSKYSKTSKCSHSLYVKKVMSENDGHYSISIPVDIDEDEAFEAAKHSATFRAFILKYGKVEVI